MSYEQYSPSGFKVLPPVVKNILIINGLFFLAMMALDKTFHIDLTDYLGLHYFAASKFEPYQFITYMFMHGSIGHIFFNMFAVWMFGSVLENVWGPRRFIIYYVITGIGAALTHYLVMYYFELSPIMTPVNQFLHDPSLQKFTALVNSPHFKMVSYDMQAQFSEFINKYNSMLATAPDQSLQAAIDFTISYKAAYLNAPVVVGASGAIFGILLAFGMMFPNSLIYLYFAIPVKAKWLVIGYAALELYSGMSDRSSNIAHFAHLGGMVFGLALMLLWRKRKLY